MTIVSYEAIYGLPAAAERSPLGPISNKPKEPSSTIPKVISIQEEENVNRKPPITAKKSAPAYPSSTKWTHPARDMFKYQPPYSHANGR